MSHAQNKNVLFIAVDDLKPLIGTYGDEWAISPNLDRLAAMGVVFTNAHCQQAVCAPSRVSLLTGLRPDLTEVRDLNTLMRDRNPDIRTLPQYFKQQGYTTIGMGKIFDPRSVDKGLDTDSWSVPHSNPKVEHPQYGKPIVSGYQSKENKARFRTLRAEGKSQGIIPKEMGAFLKKHHKPSTESVEIEDEGYFDGKLAETAVEHLNKLATDKNPFLLCVGFRKPHLPFVAPQKYWDLYDREDLPLAAFQRQASSTSNLSYHNLGEIKSYTDIPASFNENGLIQLDKQRELIHGYYACVSYIDAQIGKLLDALETTGLINNTSIVLWGDHGWHLGDHGLWNKHSNFEQATRSPLILVDPDMKAGINNASPTEFVDIFPTLCELTGLPSPEALQGKSLVPILAGKKKKVKDFAISQYPRGKIMGYALRNDRYRYVAWYKGGDISSESNIMVKELYDYKQDPLETTNVVASNRDLADKLQAQLNSFLHTQSQQKRSFQKMQKGNRKKPQKQEKAIAGLGNNLIANPGFEQGNNPWRFGKQGHIQVVKNESRSGDASLEFSGTKCSAFQHLTKLKPSTQYRLTAYAKTEKKETVLLKVRNYGGEDIVSRYQKGIWDKISLTFTTGPDHTTAGIALLKYKPNATEKSWFDDISVQEILPPSAVVSGPSIKEILWTNYPKNLYIGATIGHRQVGTSVEKILTSQFNYTVAENAGKQAQVHPEPGKWNWERINAIVQMAEKNKLAVRLHGPISPQASKWAKADDRTPEELEEVMVDFMTAQCKRFNGHPAVKWMDVVNETVNRDGTWFGPKKGVDNWENPWTIIGADTDKNQTPLYISQAFELANKFSPDIKLVYNQHGGMEPAMWDRVKETILYLREKGLRVDGIGWQAHLRSNAQLALDKDRLAYLADLIDWAHAQKLEFHVTEIDYKIMGQVNESSLQKQADAYANVLKVLLSKRESGMVTYNTWGLVDGVGKHKDLSRFMFTETGEPKPAYFKVRETLKNLDQELAIPNQSVQFSDNFNVSFFPKNWKRYGETKPDIDSSNGINGTSCIIYTTDKCGIHQVIQGLSPNTTYTIEMWSRAGQNQRLTLKASEYGGKELKKFIRGTGDYQKAILTFTTGEAARSVKMMISRWHPEWDGPIYVDDVSLQLETE